MVNEAVGGAGAHGGRIEAARSPTALPRELEAALFFFFVYAMHTCRRNENEGAAAD